jgi:hypothetical protein
MCPACGAICDEAGTGDHDAWHQAIQRKMLPSLVDFLTELDGIDEGLSAEPESSNKSYLELPKLIQADAGLTH